MRAPANTPPRALVVEDEMLVAMMLDDLLTDFGYEVVATTPSGERAIELALKERPDVVLMDVALSGGLSGIQAAHAIRAEHDCAIIFLTAYDDAGMLDKMRRVAGAMIIRKPLTEEVLKRTLSEVLAARRSTSSR